MGRDVPTLRCKQILACVAGKQSLKKPVMLTEVKVDTAVRHWAKTADLHLACWQHLLKGLSGRRGEKT